MMRAHVQIRQWYWCKLRHGVTRMGCVEAGDGYLDHRLPDGPQSEEAEVRRRRLAE